MSASTVRSRLQRAHEELRARLDRGFHGDRRAWSAVLVGWIRTGRGAGTLGASSAVALTGVGILGGKLGLGALAALAIAAAGWGIRETALALHAGGAPRGALSPERPRATTGDEILPGRAAPEPGDERTALVAPPGPADPGATDAATPLGAIAGAVRDAATGEPLPGATIVTAGRAPIATDMRGSYRLDEVPLGSALWLYARAPGHAEASARLELRDPGEATLDFDLQAGRPVVVQVLDRESGAPVEAADVHVDPRVAPFARTDADGRFELRLLEGAELFVRVVAEGYVPFVWGCESDLVAPVSAPRVPLAPCATIEGVVVDAGGRAVTGVDVVATREGSPFGSAMLGAEERERWDLPGIAGPDGLFQPRARTDERGAFRIATLPGPEPKRVVALPSAGPPATSRPIVVASSRQRPFVRIACRRGARVSGRVVFDGEPCEGARVQCDPGAGGEVQATITAPDGRYELADVPPGAVALEVWSDLWRFGPLPDAQLVVEAGESYAQDFEWSAERSTLSGTVTSEAGEPLAGVRIEASFDPPWSDSTARFEARTDGDGRYALELPADAVCDVTATLASVERSRVDVVASAREVDFVLPELGVVRLRLVDAATGAPVPVRVDPGELVFFWRMSGDDAFRRVRPTVGHEGTAELRLPVGRIDLGLQASVLGYAPAVVEDVRVPRVAERPAPVTLELARGVAVELAFEPGADVPEGVLAEHRWLLVGEARAHLARGAGVAAGRLGAWLDETCPMDRIVRADAHGRARLSGLAPGRYALLAFPDDVVAEPAVLEIAAEPSGPIDVGILPR